MHHFYIFVVLVVYVTGEPVIIDDPSSLLIPTNEIGLFSCRALCRIRQCTGHWLINNSYSHEPNSYEPKMEFLMKGFIFLHNEFNMDEYTLRLMVNASEIINNTEIYCEFDVSGSTDRIQSRTATILVIADSPLSLKPVSVENNNTHISLMWSPPFLWPGQPIEYFNLSIVDWNDKGHTHQIVNSTFSDRIVIFNFDLNKSRIQEILTCTEITFSISAVGMHHSEPLKVINITEWILPPTISLVEMISATIKTNVLFNVDATPALVEVKLELPEILCTDEELNYTLFIENNHGEFVTKLGPIQHHFSYDAIIKQSIPLDGLDQNEIFFLSVQVDIPFLEFSSHKHQFNTTYMKRASLSYITVTVITEGQDEVLLPYKVGMGVSLAFAAVLMSLVLISLYLNCKRKNNAGRRLRGLNTLIYKNMVNNPIYEENKGEPTYESVQPQLRIQTANRVPHPQHARDRSTNDSYDNILDSACVDIDALPVADVNTVRYVDHPIKLSYVAKSQSLNIEVPFSDSDHCNSCNTTSAPSLGSNMVLAGPGSHGKKDVKKNDKSISHQVNQTTLAIKKGKKTSEDINDSFTLGTQELSAAANVTEMDGNYITTNPVRISPVVDC